MTRGDSFGVCWWASSPATTGAPCAYCGVCCGTLEEQLQLALGLPEDDVDDADADADAGCLRLPRLGDGGTAREEACPRSPIYECVCLLSG